MKLSFGDDAVLITGGTMGVGLACALALAAHGARCVLTYRWGSADLDAVRAKFAAVGAHEPLILEADVGNEEDTERLLERIAQDFEHIEVFISNAAAALVTQDMDDWSERGLTKSIRYSAWPMFGYSKAIHRRFGRYPRYIVGMSSDGPDHMAVGYDFVSASKAVMETLCRYMSWQLRHEDVRVNCIRSRAVRTDSLNSTFGAEMETFMLRHVTERHFLPPEEVAGTALMLCSGLMDAVKGQVITVDRGTAFSDNLMRMYWRAEHTP